MSEYWLFVILIGYLAVLFLIAYTAEATRTGRRIANHPLTYALSLAVYCTAWTYYGSVGLAARSGVGFLTIYLGPVIAMPLWVVVLRKVISITKRHKLSTLADFISFRYGKSRMIGALVTLVCLISVVPYISLQLKAVSETFHIMSGSTELLKRTSTGVSTFFVAFVLALFAAFFGTQTSDASTRRRGIVTSVAFESLLKLVFFLVIGIVVTFVWYNGSSDVYHKALAALPDLKSTLSLNGIGAGVDWGYSIALSFVAIFLLPRQFQVSVIENFSTKHITTATWAFPLYLLLFNLFVVFIAWAGRLELGDAVNQDYYSLLLPLSRGDNWLALLVFLGGFSASISMVVISSLALSAMVSNNLIIPYGYLNRFATGNSKDNARLIKVIRRVSIFLLILLSYAFFNRFNAAISLSAIGLIAFVLIAQLAPSFFIGLFWSRATTRGAMAGIISGTVVVFYTLIIPFVQQAFFQDTSFIEHGPWGVGLLNPYKLFGLDLLTPVNHAFMWSMLVNTSALLITSIYARSGYRERNYAEMVVNEASLAGMEDQMYVWKGEAYVSDIKDVLVKFLGVNKTERALDIFYRKYDISSDKIEADSRLVLFAEKLLAGRIGSASARILIANVIKEQPVTLSDVLEIMEESKQTLASNRKLEDRSRLLHRITAELSAANKALIEQDKQKDEFLDTVAHELKTPITSIKAAAEVLQGDLEMEENVRELFITNIVNDAERLSILIHNILDIEKLESGRVALNKAEHQVSETVKKAINGVEQVARQKDVKLKLKSADESVTIAYDEDRMLQVLTNVLTNAIKFVPESTGMVNISMFKLYNLVYITIEDNGKGIPPEDAPFVFDRFYQSKDQNRRKPQGSGLGLAICKKIMERHHGDITLDPDHSKGARFIITLPVRIDEAETIDS